jgi:hypothetical protein
MSKAQESRLRIDKTKSLSLDQRIAVVDKALKELNLSPIPDDAPKLAKWLVANGYEPMMFAHACRIVQSRRNHEQ